MSYNIDSIQEIVCDAWMEMDDITILLDHHENKFPEFCFLNGLQDKVSKARSLRLTCECGIKNTKGSKFCNECGSKLPRSQPGNRIQLDNIDWSNEGSGSTWDFFKETVAPKIHGEVQAIVIWEGGDSVVGIAIKDGRVVDCDVIQSLKLPEDW